MPQTPPVDLDLVAQRILKLAEVATLEHIDSVLRSQAGEMLKELHEMAQSDHQWAEPKGRLS